MERKQAIFYLTAGSMNQNYRSQIMDGEVLFIISDVDAMIAFLDVVAMMSMVTWVESVEELEEILPSTEGFMHWVSRYIKRAV